MEQQYNFISRLFHRLALGSPLIAEASFELEQILFKCEPDDTVDGKHVFVSGLARAGTTLLMRLFHETGEYRSLTYRDMPFVLAPSLWRRLSGTFKKSMEKEERAHGDGMLVDFDSPEALEEVFWRTFCSRKYLHGNVLKPMDADREIIERFRCYIRQIICSYDDSRKKRYLSKNNNNILRLHAIRSAFPNALILVPYREPLQHAASLLYQHRRFITKQGDDEFTRRYMRWLAHHEFGLEHRPFTFPSNRPQRSLDSQTLDYWLQLWVETYGYLVGKGTEIGAVFVCYEDLCADSERILGALSSLADLEDPLGKENRISLSEKDVSDGHSPDLLREATALYTQLRSSDNTSFPV